MSFSTAPTFLAAPPRTASASAVGQDPGCGTARDCAHAGTKTSTLQSTDRRTSSSDPQALAAIPNCTTELWNNGSIEDEIGTGAGGANVSILYDTTLGKGTFGFAHSIAGTFRVADDFTVSGSPWTVGSVTFFAYQTGSTTTSTINAINVNLWNGLPGGGGTMIASGPAAAILQTVWSGTYRVLESDGLGATNRPIMQTTIQWPATFPNPLPAGTYWLDWNTGGTLGSGPWAPPLSTAGAGPGGVDNARQFDGTDWNALTDVTNVTLPFIICSGPPSECGDGLTSLLAADTLNNRVQRFDGTNWSVLMPSGLAAGQVTSPRGVTQTTDGGTIYVAEANRLQKSTDGGTTWTVISTGLGMGTTQVNAPAGVAVKPDDGNFVVVCDTGNHRVKLSTDGGTTWSILAGSGALTPNVVMSPCGAAVGCDGSVHVADTGNNRILYFAGPTPTAGTGVVAASNGSLSLNQVKGPRGVAIDNATGNLYVADTGNGRVVRYAGPVTGAVAAAGCTLVFAKGSLNAGQTQAPHGVSVSSVGGTTSSRAKAGGMKLYVSDGNLTTSRLLRTSDLTAFAPYAQVSGATAGQTGGFGSLLGQFRQPGGIR